MASTRRTSERKGIAAARLDTSIDSEEVPQTAQTPSSVSEDSRKAVTGRMPLTSEGSKIQKGQMSAARDSAESDRPARRTVRSFEEDALLQRPPPDFGLGQEYWLGLQVFIREKLWRLYRLYNPLTMDDEELSRMMEAIARGRQKLAEKKAREVFEDLQSRLDEAARRLWNDDHTRQRAEERIADAEDRIKELKAEAAAASSNQRETYDQYHKLCQEWQAEETKSRQKFSGTFHQDLVLEQPLKLPDLPPSVLHFRDSKLAEPQRLAAPSPTNAETSRAEVSAWVGSMSEDRTAARRTPQPRGLRAKKLIAFSVGEGVPFSDCYRNFRKVVHNAKRDGQFAANFNTVQSIVSVLMKQQYPTLYGITFPRNTPNRYFLNEAQMWKALDLQKRNVTRSLPPRCDTGVCGSSEGSAPGVGSSSAKISSETSGTWVPESIMRMQSRLKRKSQHNKQKRHSTRNSQKRRNSDRSEVDVTTDQTKKFVKTPEASESSSN